MAKAVPIEIKSNQSKPISLYKATHLKIKNKSSGLIYYSFGGMKVTLEAGEEDEYPSPNHPISGRLEFYIPKATNQIRIKVIKIEKE